MSRNYGAKNIHNWRAWKVGGWEAIWTESQAWDYIKIFQAIPDIITTPKIYYFEKAKKEESYEYKPLKTVRTKKPHNQISV